MEMQLKHGLPPIFTCVYNNSVAILIKPLTAGDLPRNQEQVPKHLFVLCIRFSQTGNRDLGDD
jgi:hypothetical protein